MIYLIKSAGYGKDNNYIDLLKIGYTEDTKKEGRFNAYKLHNPTCKILYELPELTEEDEKNIQYKFRKYLYIDYGREWFEYNDEIVNFFKNPEVVKNIKNLPINPCIINKELTEFKNSVKEILGILLGISSNLPGKGRDNVKSVFKEILDKKLRDIDSVFEFLELKFDKSIIDKCKDLLECRKTGKYCNDDIINQEISEFLGEYQKLGTFRSKLRYLCEYGFSDQVIGVVLDQIGEHDNIKSYYLALGPQKLRACGYNRYDIEKELGVVTFSQELLESIIYSEFKVGDKITLADIKDRLGYLYSSINYDATPKAKDLENYFNVKESSARVEIDGVKKVVKIYNIISRK
jgi:hypothetical protein